MRFTKLVLASLSLAAIPLIASAGVLTDKAYQVAGQLGSRESTLSPAQQTQVSRHLDGILSALNGTGTERNYICVSRDNDNNRPYVLAYRDFAETVRITGAAFDSKQECEQSLGASEYKMGRLFLCASRDQDGNRPYQMVALNGANKASALQRSVLGTMADCQASVHAMKQALEGVLYYGSRDNDGNRPFSPTGLKNDGTYVYGRDQFDTIQACNAAL